MAGAFIARECGLLVPELEAGRGRGHGGGGGGEQEAVEHGGALAGERRLGGGHGEISASLETGGEARGRSALYRQSDEVTRKPDHFQCHQGSLSY